MGISEPLVSICCITYNHAPFIRRCLEGFLMQKVDFPYEILIHDDCSTDGTDVIVREYAERYPDLIFPLFEEVNQFSLGKASEIDFFNYKRARGKYIAYCEGDDYWTEPTKLQRQVNFLEAHPDYTVCFHKAQKYVCDTGEFLPVYDKDFPCSPNEDFDVDTKVFLRTSVGQPLTMVFRLSAYNFEWQKHYTGYCDYMEIYHLLREGKGRFLNFTGGQYNLHGGGICTSGADFPRSLETCWTAIEMYEYTKDQYLITELDNAISWSLQLSREIQGGRCQLVKVLGKICAKSPVVGIRLVLRYQKRCLKHMIFG